MSHTPGPWEVSRSPRGAIAKVTSNCTQGDAELMAAAPMLLEQRDELLAALENFVSIAYEPESEIRRSDVAQAEAAIAKAKGAPAGRNS